MFKVKMYGAGSIGNHLAYACRQKNWDVLICDVDPRALERTKTDIYPARYGHWDERIRLVTTLGSLQDEEFDLIVIGTPPDTHIQLALEVLTNKPPKILLIEKPLCTPSLGGCQDIFDLAKTSGTFVTVGYNHTLTKNSQMATEILRSGSVGRPLTISAKFREHWGGIFVAHPWLKGPQDTYLGFSERGGGAGGEHSHAINIWQYFAHLLGVGRIVEVSAMLDVVGDGKSQYDRICQLNVRTENGLVGNIVQDVITEPSQKSLRIQGSDGFLEWYVNWDKANDAVRYSGNEDEIQEKLILKTRIDDFKWEIEHLEQILEGKVRESPISLERGLDTMMVIAAAHLSHKQKRMMGIDYSKGYVPGAIYAI